VPAVVRIGVTPVSGVAAYAIEESLPPGWRVSNVGENGSLLSSSGMIRWGPFLGDQPRVLTYNVTAPSGVASAAVFDGRAAFDGFTQVIGGAEKAGAADAQTGLRISGAERTAESKLRLQIHGKAGQLCVLEASSDLNRWIELEQTIVGDNGSVSIEDTGIQVQARFYRLRVPFGPSGIPE
jgi:hypothetical protein